MTHTSFKFPKSRGGLLGMAGAREANLEDEVMIWDFFRSDAGWNEDEPLVLCKDGGLLAMVGVRGIDPESFDQAVFDDASKAIRRAMDGFNLDSLEEAFHGGSWEIGNSLMRLEVKAPNLAKLVRPSAALRFMNSKTEEFWGNRKLMDDQIIFWVKFWPRMKSRLSIWNTRDPKFYAELKKDAVQLQAGMVRRAVRSFIEGLMSFTTPRPVQTMGAKWLNVDQTYRALHHLVNRGLVDPQEYDPYLSLTTQVCMTTRENYRTRRYYAINDNPTAVLTWKMAPRNSWGNHMAVFQDRCNFPFFLTNTWEPVNAVERMALIGRNMAPAVTLSKGNKAIEEWLEEADTFKTSVQIEAVTPMNWRFTVVVTGKDATELEERVNRLKTWIKTVGGAEPLVEGVEARHLAEMSSLPGGRYLNLRTNIITSENAGDSAFVYRLNTGSSTPHIVFGNRRMGTYGFDIFSSDLPNWNCAIIGGPGSGKSVLQNLLVHGLVGYPSQLYVMDIGGSFGRTFEWLRKELGGGATTMRFAANDFTFNPLPMVWAIRERTKQIQNDTYMKPVGDGVVMPCPVQSARQFFESFLEVLLSGEDRRFSPQTRNRLDKALFGADLSGDGGFFRHFETLCEQYIEYLEEGRDAVLPEPLTQLLTFVKTEVPELADALELWTRGEKKRFFDTGKDVFNDTKAVYFELTGLDENKAVAGPFVAALMGSIWRKILDPQTLRERKLIVIDEAWKFLGDPAFAPMIEMMFRTIRKFGGAVVLGTQTPDEIKKGEGIKLLRTMSHVFLYKGFNDEEFFKVHLQMTSNQVRLYLDMQMNDQVREVFHWDQTGRTQILDVKLDPHRYWVLTSEATDKAIWSSLVERNGGDELATIEALAESTGYRTIASKELRHKVVLDHFASKGIPMEVL